MQSIFSKQIERLVEKPELNSWIQQGLILHAELESSICEYCKQPIPTERINELNNHFSESYNHLVDSLKNLDLYIQLVIQNINITLADPLELYEEFQKDYYDARIEHLKIIETCNKELNSVLEQLNRKIQNPFEIINYQFDNIESCFIKINDSIQTMFSLVEKHNTKNQKFDEIVKDAQNKLELHFVVEQLTTNDYFVSESKIRELEKTQSELDSEVNIANEIVQSFEASLLNEAIGATQFNKSLAKFLGRNDITLEFDKNLKGYKLIRGDSTTPAINLSEGEKTAIAFVYFISKLKENGNQIEETIIVVDDPISSFDSNHLFHSYSYLKFECEKAAQLFILTHNFQYFKLIRDWLIKKNETKWENGNKVEKIKSRFYSIECTNEKNRKPTIKNANSTLIKYNSEYHYVFYKLNELKDLPHLDIEKAFLISNLSRKLLEAFLAFKFPKGRNDFSQLLQAGCTDSELREKVYRFINKYSHNQQIDFHDTPIDNLLGEGNNIVNEVFKILEDLDVTHYQEMKEVIVA